MPGVGYRIAGKRSSTHWRQGAVLVVATTIQEVSCLVMHVELVNIAIFCSVPLAAVVTTLEIERYKRQASSH